MKDSIILTDMKDSQAKHDDAVDSSNNNDDNNDDAIINEVTNDDDDDDDDLPSIQPVITNDIRYEVDAMTIMM